ncbi:hypothetical protein [Crossiella cryophila]|uniref:Putative membrane protein YgcG n=1 Tax=Crossiella cryophila TaxID=43355 RepID=A0A7W7FS27_9PSEU|nr:hypothetical protein [Crossiella cryophila]MBB4675515.1 putative membrane protein YgcG [Crossiella cryophila]
MMRTVRLTAALLLGLIFALPGTAVAQQVPQLSADRSSGLDPAGERIVVRGTGFAANATLALGAWSGSTADPAGPAAITTAPDGGFATELLVSPAFAPAGGPVELRVSVAGVAPLPLGFGGNPPATSTPATPPATSTPVTSTPGTATSAPPAAPRIDAPQAEAAAAPKLAASKTQGLNAAGEKVTVTGSGYNEAKGIYVAVCVDNGSGKMPTPCLGGADLSGKNGNSAWISSNPPPYGKDLAKPYGPGGSFSVELTVTAKDEYTDCNVLKCAIVSRADHTLGADRSQDAILPITFGGNGNPPPTTTTTPPPGGGGGEQPGGGTGGGGGGTGGGGGGGGRSGGLANTGAGPILPITLGGLALLAGGAFALYAGRRRSTVD